LKNSEKQKKRMSEKAKIYIETYGCAANKSDSEIMIGLLNEARFQIAKNLKEADVIIINTCIVKTPTAKRMEKRIKELYSSNKPLIVAGCMAKAEPERIEMLAPKASRITPDAIDKIVEVVNETLKGKKIVADSEKKEKVLLPKIPFNKIISIVQISSGCLSACSFCETRVAKGILKSYRPSSIVERIKRDLEGGFKEFWITSQDNACYGFDLDTNLAELLREIVKLNGNFLVRVGMMNPTHLIKREKLLKDLIEVYKSEKIFKFAHLPLQSGSDKVLRDMNRGYTFEEFMKIVEEFRKEIPNITIETDIIVGFPTETEEDFEETIKAVKILQPDVVNISKFSPRPHTPAEKLKQLPVEIVKGRSKILYELTKEIALKKNKKFVGKEVWIFVDEVGKESSFIGRTIEYKPVVVKTEENIFGKIVRVRIEEAKSNFLVGSILKNKV
jgi:MiaB-like tRNA modifying enzyme